MATPNQDILKLFSLTAGKCSICKTDLFVESVKIGEMAHVIPRKEKGPRGEFSIRGDRDGYDNLILLCPTHHTIVDKNPRKYPPEVLHRIKAEHERLVQVPFGVDSRRAQDIAGLKTIMRYMPFTQIPALLEFLPINFRLQLLEVSSVIECFPIDNPQCDPFSDSVLEKKYEKFCQSFSYLIDCLTGSSSSGWSKYGEGRELGNQFVASINRDLPYWERVEHINLTDELSAKVKVDHRNLLRYLRDNYPTVDLTTYKKIKI